MHFEPQFVHLRQLGLDQVLVRITLALLRQDCLISCLNTLLQLLVPLNVQSAKVLRALEHHVLKHVSDARLASLFKG